MRQIIYKTNNLSLTGSWTRSNLYSNKQNVRIFYLLWRSYCWKWDETRSSSNKWFKWLFFWTEKNNRFSKYNRFQVPKQTELYLLWRNNVQIRVLHKVHGLRFGKSPIHPQFWTSCHHRKQGRFNLYSDKSVDDNFEILSWDIE